ncbi:hypothetical protein GCK32_021865 [Trichostrongylus colubriformis]|uniref:Uncharacterized protein n=1 Tax=Trichostrongylus colubriformis TaxID=6319 RepID=A0AAN8F267_TRICO
MWCFYFLSFALVIGFYNGLVIARPSYTDMYRNLMANSRSRVTFAPWKWTTTTTTPESVPEAQEGVFEDGNLGEDFASDNTGEGYEEAN